MSVPAAYERTTLARRRAYLELAQDTLAKAIDCTPPSESEIGQQAFKTIGTLIDDTDLMISHVELPDSGHDVGTPCPWCDFKAADILEERLHMIIHHADILAERRKEFGQL
jgi:hypothetical protein